MRCACATGGGPPGHSDTGQQPDLAGQPEILAAARAHRRLARRHGHEKARAAYYQARRVLDEWKDSGHHDYAQSEGFGRRITAFLGPGWSVRRDSAFAAAARYPQVVALAQLLASPYWTGLAVRDHVAAGRPDRGRRERAADAVAGYHADALRRGDLFPDPFIPGDLADEIAAGLLLPDGPHLRVFVAEVQRTVEPGYEWSPVPRAIRLKDLRGPMPVEPLLDLISKQAQAELDRMAGLPVT